MKSSTSFHAARLIANNTSPRFAPAQKFGASFPITIPFQPSDSARSTASTSISTMNGSTAFIFEWYSTSRTSSPISQRLAEPLRLRGLPLRLRSATVRVDSGLSTVTMEPSGASLWISPSSIE